jgi:two-component system sensor histidine kinase QseC
VQRSIRFRLLLSAAICGTALLAMLGLSIYIAMRQALYKDFDASLATQARALTTMIDIDHGKMAFDFEPGQLPEFASAGSGHYFEITNGAGTIIARSPSLGTSQNAGVRVLPDERLGRSVTVPFTLDNDDEKAGAHKSSATSGTITMTANATEIEHTLHTLAILITTFSAAAVTILVFLLWRAVVRGLNPLNQLAGRIGLLGEGDLHQRLESKGSPQELAPVVEKLNGLLSRLEAAFTREKAFSADVAHELRTPIAGLRATIEVARLRPRSAQEYESAIDECGGVVEQMDAMVEALLLMARGEAGQLSIEPTKIDLPELVRSVWEPLAARARSRGLNCTFDLPEWCEIITDSAKLRIILHNLLDNAVSYANEGGTIKVIASNEAIRIINSGSQISAMDTPRLFDRFWRGDASRTDTANHSGLGLSLCHRLTSLLGGQIEIAAECGKDFDVRVAIPTPAISDVPLNVSKVT